MSFRFARLPQPVFDALKRGDITPLQFNILAMLHGKADRYTGIVASWSAEEFLFLMGNPDLPQPRTVRRAMQELREMGWYSHDYVKGRKRPYNVILNNFAAFRAVQAGDQENQEGNDQEIVILNPHAIKTCRSTSCDSDQDNSLGHDQGALGQMSTKYQIKDAPPAPFLGGSAPLSPLGGKSQTATPLKPTQENQPFGQKEACDKLRDILLWLPKNAPSVIGRLLQTFTFEEIKRALTQEETFGRVYVDVDSTKRFFRSDGAELEVDLRQSRKQHQIASAIVNIFGFSRAKATEISRREDFPRILERMRTEVNQKRKAKS
jgi:hypothetical protein